MKRTIRIVLIISIVTALIVSFVVCIKIRPANLVGDWNGSWEYNGTINQTITFYSNGNFSELTYIDGNFYERETGTYELNGIHVRLYCNSEYPPHQTEYIYIGKTLRNNGHVLSKVKKFIQLL